MGLSSVDCSSTGPSGQGSGLRLSCTSPGGGSQQPRRVNGGTRARLCALGYHFEHVKGKHTLVLTDSCHVGHPVSPGCESLPLRYADVASHTSQLSSTAECVFDLSCQQQVQPGKAVIQDYDFTRPQLSLLQKSAASGSHSLGDMEVFDYPGFYDKEGDGSHFVGAQMDEYAGQTALTWARTDARAGCRVKAQMPLARWPSNPMALLLLVAIARAMTPRRA
jgi:uncharacterized protein involved in type VI secretion and phage assembly